jgi:hypothetical protein
MTAGITAASCFATAQFMASGLRFGLGGGNTRCHAQQLRSFDLLYGL